MSKRVKATNYFVEATKQHINCAQLTEYLDFMDREGFDLVKVDCFDRRPNEDQCKYLTIWKYRKPKGKPKPAREEDEFEPD